MDIRKVLLAVSAFSLLLSGCAEPQKLVYPPYSGEDHEHIYPLTRTFGPSHYHAMMMYHQATGMLGLIFLDKDEYPVNVLNADKVKAVLTGPDEQPREFFFENQSSFADQFSYYRGRGYRFSGSRRVPANKVVVEYDWLKNIPRFNLKVWIPLGDTIYLLEYDYPGTET
jgi:hypothetical protein